MSQNVGERTGRGRDEHGGREPGQQPHAGGQRRVAQHELEVLGDEEGGGEGRARHEERGRVAGRECPDAEQRQRQHRLGRPAFPPEEGGQEGRAHGQGGDGPGAAPAGLARVHEPPDEADGTGRNERHPPQVEPGRCAVALRQQPQRQQAGGHPDRNVDPEDPVPVQSLGDQATDQRADRDGQARQPAVDADDHAPALHGKRSRQDRQAERQDGRAAQALHGTGGDQRGRAGRQGTGGRGEGEQRQARDEDPAPPEAVGERGGGDDTRGERDAVGVHRPLQGRQPDVEVTLHPRQRRYYHQRVQHHHEVRGGREPEYPATPGPL